MLVITNHKGDQEMPMELQVVLVLFPEAVKNAFYYSLKYTSHH